MKRMGKLLWEKLNPDSDFSQKVVWWHRQLTEDSLNCADILPPIQQKLNEVLKSLTETEQLNRATGQADWGEAFYFKDELRDFVREQLKRASLQLLDQASLFAEDAKYSIKLLVRETTEFLPPIIADPDRAYIGEVMEDFSKFIWVRGSNGTRKLLRSANAPYGAPEQLTWGYAGHGSFTSAESILTDATDGNLALAKEYALDFLKEILMERPQHHRFEIARSEVLRWLESHGRNPSDIERSTNKLRDASKAFEQKLEHLIRVSKEPLKEQRFDIVPEDFEASLYVNLYQMIQNGRQIMRCSGCQLPLSYIKSTRGNQQLARWKKGLSVYHAGCLEQCRKDQKRLDSRERARRKRQAVKGGVKL